MQNWIVWNRTVFDIETESFKMYLHLNYVLMLNWIIWNGTAFDIETVCKQSLYLY